MYAHFDRIYSSWVKPALAHLYCLWGSKYQGQGQVITSHCICMMYILVPVLDTSLWHTSPRIITTNNYTINNITNNPLRANLVHQGTWQLQNSWVHFNTKKQYHQVKNGDVRTIYLQNALLVRQHDYIVAIHGDGGTGKKGNKHTQVQAI